MSDRANQNRIEEFWKGLDHSKNSNENWFPKNQIETEVPPGVDESDKVDNVTALSGCLGVMLTWVICGGMAAAFVAGPFWLFGMQSTGNWVWSISLLIIGSGMSGLYRQVVRRAGSVQESTKD